MGKTKNKMLENKQCRTCYNAAKSLKLLTDLTKCSRDLQQKSYAELIKEVSGINIMEDYKVLPQFICAGCLRKLKAAHAFIRQIHEVNDRLMEMFNDREETNKELVEAQIGNESCIIDIKTEHDDAVIDYQADAKCNTKLEMVEFNEFTQNHFLAINAQDMNDEEIVVEERIDIKNENFNDLLDEASDVKLEINSKKSIDLYKPNENESDCGNDGIIDDSNLEKLKEEKARNLDNGISMEKKFSKSRKSVEILKPSTQNRIFQCSKCPRSYAKKQHLNIHMKNKHIRKTGSNGKSIKVVIGETLLHRNKPMRYEVRLLCNICGSSFASKTHFNAHMRTHTLGRLFKCDLCDRAYSRKTLLTCHRRIHIGAKPLVCKICGISFRASSKMAKHMRLHTDIH